MKKDIEWLKNEVNELPLRFLGFSMLKQREEFAVSKDDVMELINQIDEPETLSQEWIDEYAQGDYDEWVYAEDLQNLLVPKQEEITHKQVEKYLLDKNIRVIDIDIYEEMQSELEELKNGVTLSKTETVADVIADFYKSLERFKEVISMEVEELGK